MVAPWRRSCRRPCTLAQIPSTRTTFKKRSRLGNLRGACVNICAAELKPLVGARQSGATGQAQDLPGTIGAYAESKAALHRGACEPRAHVPH